MLAKPAIAVAIMLSSAIVAVGAVSGRAPRPPHQVRPELPPVREIVVSRKTDLAPNPDAFENRWLIPPPAAVVAPPPPPAAQPVRSVRKIRIAERADVCGRHGMRKVMVGRWRWRCR